MFIYKLEQNTVQYAYYPKFEELAPRNNNEQRKWLKKRRQSYDASFRHFLKALACRELQKAHFELFFTPGGSGDRRGPKMTSWINRFLEPDNSGLIRFRYDGILCVVYSGNGEISHIKLKKDYVLIDTLGNCFDPMAIFQMGAFAQKRVADLVPLDYEPDE